MAAAGVLSRRCPEEDEKLLLESIRHRRDRQQGGKQRRRRIQMRLSFFVSNRVKLRSLGGVAFRSASGETERPYFFVLE